MAAAVDPSCDPLSQDGIGTAHVGVSIAGELDMAREGEVGDLVVPLTLEPGTVVGLDVRDVTFVDSAGLRSILHARAYLDEQKCDLALIAPNSQLRKLIEISGLLEVLAILPVDS